MNVMTLKPCLVSKTSRIASALVSIFRSYYQFEETPIFGIQGSAQDVTPYNETDDYQFD